jgi:hypothetical protein
MPHHLIPEASAQSEFACLMSWGAEGMIASETRPEN